MSLKTFGQFSLRNPLICHDKEDKLKCFDDGNFRLSFMNAKFINFVTNDSTIKYFESDRNIEIYNYSLNRIPVRIKLFDKTIIFEYSGKIYKIDSTKTLSLTLNNILFSLEKQESDYRITFEINGKKVYLDINVIYKFWTWDDIFIKREFYWFSLKYNPYRNFGPTHIAMQDENLKYGISIATSFKTAKYIWYVQPVFYAETEKSNIINLLTDFYLEYDKKGILKKKKCIGTIKYCDFD
jgi:hypothetical protein